MNLWRLRYLEWHQIGNAFYLITSLWIKQIGRGVIPVNFVATPSTYFQRFSVFLFLYQFVDSRRKNYVNIFKLIFGRT
jgi:hypothetical protein